MALPWEPGAPSPPFPATQAGDPGLLPASATPAFLSGRSTSAPPSCTPTLAERSPLYPPPPTPTFGLLHLLYRILGNHTFSHASLPIFSLHSNWIYLLFVLLQTPVSHSGDWVRPLVPSLRSSIFPRSEERRVGKECTSWCRSRWSPYH